MHMLGLKCHLQYVYKIYWQVIDESDCQYESSSIIDRFFTIQENNLI